MQEFEDLDKNDKVYGFMTNDDILDKVSNDNSKIEVKVMKLLKKY